MDEAIRLIAARSPSSARGAINLLRTPTNSPLRQNRYNRIAEWAMSDPEADFTREERELIASFLESTDDEDGRAFMLRVRLTESERERLRAASDEAGMTMSEYARRRLFSP